MLPHRQRDKVTSPTEKESDPCRALRPSESP
jgi:hypothetical protein